MMAAAVVGIIGASVLAVIAVGFLLFTQVGRAILIVGLVCLVGWFFVSQIGNAYSHASKHVNTSTIADQCFNNHGTSLSARTDDNPNKLMEYCFDPDSGNISVRIVKRINGKAEEITKYTEKGKYNPDDVIAMAERDSGPRGWISYAAEGFLKLLTAGR